MSAEYAIDHSLSRAKRMRSSRRLPDLRRQVEGELGRPLPDETWTRITAESDLRHVQPGSAAYRELVAHASRPDAVAHAAVVESAERFRVPFRHGAQLILPPLHVEQVASAPLSREEALSHLVAQDADMEPAVTAFRADPATGLAEGVIAWSELTTWLYGHVDLSGVVRSEEEPGFIDFLIPESSQYAFRLPVPGPDSVLDRLGKLGESLRERYTWLPAQATVFVLTGQVPGIAVFSGSAGGFRRVPALYRITLTVDPTLAPREVGAIYRAMRTERLGAQHRDLTDKHLRLAVFAAQRKSGTTWAQSMEEWNTLVGPVHPDWIYRRATNFARDGAAARKRLLGLKSRDDARAHMGGGVEMGKARTD
jgi:hypothetical protein